MQKAKTYLIASARKYISWATIALAALTQSFSYGFEFNGERWRESIEYHYMTGCPDYVVPSIEKAFELVSPVAHSNTGKRDSVGFDYKVTIYCADSPAQQIQFIPSEIEMTQTNFAVDEQTIGATTRRYWIKDSLKIVDFDIWLNSAVINIDNIDQILSHEVLHGLGISHSNNPDALMYFLPRATQMHADDLAGISLLYEICEDSIDKEFNFFMHRVPVEGVNYYGILPNGGVWPDDVHTIGHSVCE